VRNAEYSLPLGLGIRNDTPDRTGDLYGISNLDEDWHNMNQMIKYYKFGFGKVTEYVNDEIRAGTLPRDEAIKIVEKYDGCCGEDYIASFCDFIGVTPTEFWDQVKGSLNRDLFDVNHNGAIVRKFEVGVGL
jgi:hypothetical protein